MTEILKKSFEDRLQKAVQLISSANFQYLKIGIFGSYARGTATGSSDIDIAIIVNERPDRHISGPLREECEILGVDVVFMTMDYFQNDDSLFATEVRKDWREIDEKRLL